MNTFEMKLWGWSGECHIHSIPSEMYEYLRTIEANDYKGGEISKLLYSLDSINDIPWDDDNPPVDEVDPKIREWLTPDGKDFYWHEGDIFCGIRPTPSVFSIEVNDKELDLSKFGLDVPFPYKSECEMENEHDNLGATERTYYVPTIGFCSYEKGYQGSYTIETSDKEFDIDKVEVDIVHTSFSSFIEGYYYDGKLMEQTGDPEGDPKSFEVNFGLLPQEQINDYYDNDVSGRFVA